MPAILALTRLLSLVNASLLWVGRWAAVGCLGLMVVIILMQVFARYILNNALPWPDEAARFFMLWMTGVVAPTAYRRGGFVAIDMLLLVLPRAVASLLSFGLLAVGLLVLIVAAQIGWAEVTGFSGRFATASLWVIDLGGEWSRVPRSWMMASLLVGVWLMISVTIELMLRQILTAIGRGEDVPPIPESTTVGAE